LRSKILLRNKSPTIFCITLTTESGLLEKKGYDFNGYGISDLKWYWRLGYHSGGAGYLMSREAFKCLGSKLNNDFEYCEKSGIEDIDVAL
jgi:hypothetical protein